MSAKTIFILTITNVIVIAVCYMYFYHKNEAGDILICDGNLKLESTAKENVNIKVEARIAIHFTKHDSYVSELGTVSVGDKTFHVDRNVKYVFSEKSSTGFYTATRIGVVKNQKDNSPDEVTALLTSAQTVFHYRVRNLNDNIWSLEDLRRTILICKSL